MTLQLPAKDDAEAVRITQYGPDGVSKRRQETALQKGPYAGGVQIRTYQSNNILEQIQTFYSGMPPTLGYTATFDAHGNYLTESSFDKSGNRETEGHQLADSTFEQNTYFPDGKTVYDHAILGRVMLHEPKLEWKPFSEEFYRQNMTLAATKQRMDDGGVVSQFYDEKHCLLESLYLDSAKTATETDYGADCKTPVLRTLFGTSPAKAYDFDAQGKVAHRYRIWTDGSWEVTVYHDGVPQYMQDWEVDHSKSDKDAKPPKLVFYLSWVKELRQDESIVREIHFHTNSKIVEKIEVNEDPPKDAKLKPAEGLPPLGSTKPATNWTPPAKASTPAAPADRLAFLDTIRKARH